MELRTNNAFNIPKTYNPHAIYDLFSVQGPVCDLKNAPAWAKAKVLEGLGLPNIANKAKELAGQETRDTFTKLSEKGDFANLHMGIHDEALAKHLDEQIQLLDQPEALAKVKESQYFTPVEHMPQELVQKGWENTIHAVAKGELAVPDRMKVQPSVHYASTNDFTNFDMTKGYDAYYERAKDYYKLPEGTRGMMDVTPSDYHKAVQERFIPPADAYEQYAKANTGNLAPEDYRYTHTEMKNRGISKGDYLPADEYGREGALYRATMPEKLGDLHLEAPSLKTLALPPSVKEVNSVQIRDGGYIGDLSLKNVAINHLNVLDTQPTFIEKLDLSDSTVDTHHLRSLSVEEANLSNASLQNGRWQNVNMGTTKDGVSLSNLHDTDLDGTTFENNSKLVGSMNGDTSLRDTKWDNSTFQDFQPHFDAPYYDEAKNKPLTPSAFEGVAPENAPKDYYSQAFKNDSQWPPEAYESSTQLKTTD